MNNVDCQRKLKFEKTLPIIPILFLIASLFLYACNIDQDVKNREVYNDTIPYSTPDSLMQLTMDQEASFDALNSIQVNGEHLYSTFSGVPHDCSSPPDTSFIISRDEFQDALEELLRRYYSNLSSEKQAELASIAVLAQEEYSVLQCNDYSVETIQNGKQIFPMAGSWILPKVLGRRDIIIKW